MPRNKENHVAYQAKLAEEKLLGTKFCFNCQKDRPLETGKRFVRGNTVVWKCAECAAKITKSGFKNATKKKETRPEQNH